ncbi:Hypothetical protein FKW44_014120, partial [Caligus rogercresseyi]
IDTALLNIKSLVAKKKKNSFIEVEDLRAIIIGAAARYSALQIKIPNAASDDWKWAGN